MRVVFMGTPDFAVPSLAALAGAHDVIAVYTRSDAASGRGSALRPSPVKVEALLHGIEVRQPGSLRDPDVVIQLAGDAPDVIVVAAYGMILPRTILEVPPHGALNVHASLLPRWRGAAPIERAILAGDSRAGVSIMLMEEGLDTGPFCRTSSTAIDDKNAATLTSELAVLGAEALLLALDDVAGRGCAWIAQDESLVTYADKITKSELSLAPELTVAAALARVRASSRRAPARLRIAGSHLTVVSAAVADRSLQPGDVACATQGLLLGFSDGTACVTRVKPQGRGEMDASAFCRGAHFDALTRWESIHEV